MAKEKVKISFIGNNAIGVTGSLTLVEYKSIKILLDCGLKQGGGILEDYKANKNAFKKIKAENIDYVFLSHAHIDHSSLIGKLTKEGFKGKIISTHITAELLKPLLMDSAFINEKDSEYLSLKNKVKIEPLYNEDDVREALNLIWEYDYNILYKLDENISFKLLKNSHIIGACQIELFIKDESGYVNKILYTGDLGNTKFKKPYVEKMDYAKTADIVICESTYGNRNIQLDKKDRLEDLSKIYNTIKEVVIKDSGQILIPCFSLDRSQFLLTILYDLFNEENDFEDVQVIVDSPLTKKITDIYLQNLKGIELEKFKKITEWKNVRFITDSDSSKLSVADKKKKIVISASGFLDKGRSKYYLQKYLPNEKNALLFVGYASPNSLAGRIKGQNVKKSIMIDGNHYKNACKIINVNSFSSHMQKGQIVDYLKSINCSKICLVHGDSEAKISLKETLEEELRVIGKTTNVCISEKDTSITL